MANQIPHTEEPNTSPPPVPTLSPPLDTVRIKSAKRPELGYVVINLRDFDPAKHELYAEQTPEVAAQFEQVAQQVGAEMSAQAGTEASAGASAPEPEQPAPESGNRLDNYDKPTGRQRTRKG